MARSRGPYGCSVKFRHRWLSLVIVVGVGIGLPTPTSDSNFRPVSLKQSEIGCLRDVIYFETTAKSKIKAKAVSAVVLNRVEKSGWSVCNIVYTGNAFTWVTHNKQNIKYRPTTKKVIQYKKAWEASEAWATEFLRDYYNNDFSDITVGATHFHNASAKPGWDKKMIPTCRIDDLVFYKEKWQQKMK